ncbi:hypothetical protein [uncultured Rikenella sp.]|uniref:hypothetical protein n=1 Tax=uncultured Rikenella sp. TaxID=368003 RepID=UPI002625DEC1|nr:hypothetical protein [uncultured Rikenella sp.]
MMALGCCVGFSVPFVHNRRCQREQCKRSLQIAERRGGRRSQREQFEAARTRQSPARVKGHILPIGGEPIRQEWPRATEIGVDTTSFRVPSSTARHALGGKSFKNAIVFE